MFGNLGMTEILMLLMICLVLFGAKRIPEIGSSVGRGIREFKRSISGVGEDAAPGTAIAPFKSPNRTDTDATNVQPRRVV